MTIKRVIKIILCFIIDPIQSYKIIKVGRLMKKAEKEQANGLDDHAES
jgi:hypothetical protein